MRRHLGLGAVAVVVALTAPAVPLAGAQPGTDPLAAEIARWQREADRDVEGVDLWAQVKPGSQAALAQAKDALAAGRRWFALERLSAARNLLSSALYISGRQPQTRKGVAAFETEWRRVGAELGAALNPPGGDALQAVTPAAARALSEVAAFQTHILYDASLEYGRATDADSGLYYLGSALAQQEFLTLARRLPREIRSGVPLRSVTADADALERTLLSLYRPPVSIDRHPEFIGASSSLKEARELDAAGLRYGAMFKLLQATQRVALFQVSTPRPIDQLRRDLQTVTTDLAGDARDHTVVQVFLERAAIELEKPAPDAAALTAVTTILDYVVPAYRTALAPAPAASPAVTAEVTVRLVRWPFT